MSESSDEIYERAGRVGDYLRGNIEAKTATEIYLKPDKLQQLIDWVKEEDEDCTGFVNTYLLKRKIKELRDE